jgi:hypothetical protein
VPPVVRRAWRRLAPRTRLGKRAAKVAFRLAGRGNRQGIARCDQRPCAREVGQRARPTTAHGTLGRAERLRRALLPKGSARRSCNSGSSGASSAAWPSRREACSKCCTCVRKSPSASAVSQAPGAPLRSAPADLNCRRLDPATAVFESSANRQSASKQEQDGHLAADSAACKYDAKCYE